MRSIFCTTCGAKIEYSSAKPKFCSSCGEPMDSSISSTNKVMQRNTERQKIKEIGEDETDADQVPSIANLEYDIEVPQDNIFNLGSILNEGQKENKE